MASSPTANDNKMDYFKPTRRGSTDIGWWWNSFKDENQKTIVCHFCGHPSTGGITRAKYHQLGIKGREVKPCEKTPEDVKILLKNYFDSKQAAKDACSGPAKGLPMQTPESAPAPNCTKERKKRGRPLQYELGSKAGLSPMPVSFAFPMTGEFSASKRGRGLNDFEDDGPSNSIGSHFSHHAFIVNSGEDVASRISLLALDFQAISVLSGSGSISSVTIDMSDSGIETLKYEGIFDLLSLTGSFEPNKDGLVSGKLTVSLAIGGRVTQGPLAGSLVAAGPVKVVVASFCPPKTQKQKKGKEIADHS